MEIADMFYLVLIIAIFLGFTTGYIYRARGIPFLGKWKTPFMGTKTEYSIGIGRGNTIDEIQQNNALVLTKRDVSDVNADFVADPFLLCRKEKWYMFMEVYNKSRNLGEIGMAVSDDSVKWVYQSIVLREPFHLSYPYVFEHQHEIWMIPETAKDNSVRLYRALNFPWTWKMEKKLLSGKPYTDASIFQHKGLWWLFASCNISRDLILYFAKDLMGPWKMHPRSPVVYYQPQKARCAGRVVIIDGKKLIRFAQDCGNEYGKSVKAFCIDCIDKENYKETPLKKSPVLSAAGRTWKADGMHHIDLHLLENGSYLAAVDGWKTVRDFGLKY